MWLCGQTAGYVTHSRAFEFDLGSGATAAPPSPNRRHLIEVCFRSAADIYDEVSPGIRALGLDTECLGGGRIEHFPDAKKLKVYGHSTVCLVILPSRSSSINTLLVCFVPRSQGFGRADHAESRRVLLTKYTDYTIETSDEGY